MLVLERVVSFVAALIQSAVAVFGQPSTEWLKKAAWILVSAVVGAVVGVLMICRVPALFGRRKCPWKGLYACGPSKGNAERLVTALHQRWFGSDTDYRISIYVPQPNPIETKSWECLARSCGKPSAERWPNDHSPAGIAFGGLVNATAAKFQPLDVPGIPTEKRSDGALVAEYCRVARVDTKRHAELSWKYASMRSDLARARNGTICCILLIERESGQPIESLTTTSDAIADELQLVALTWPSAWEE